MPITMDEIRADWIYRLKAEYREVWAKINAVEPNTGDHFDLLDDQACLEHQLKSAGVDVDRLASEMDDRDLASQS